MNTTKFGNILYTLRERLSAIEHERWSHWQRYMHSQSEKGPDGSLLIPADLVERWERQMSTKYDDLSEEEKNSDREQVDNYISVIEKELIDTFNK